VLVVFEKLVFLHKGTASWPRNKQMTHQYKPLWSLDKQGREANSQKYIRAYVSLLTCLMGLKSQAGHITEQGRIQESTGHNTVTCRLVHATNKMGSCPDDWIY
jgi:hypothetical protein